MLAVVEKKRKGRDGCERMCAVSRSVLPPSQLIRFVADPSGTIVPDIKGTLPGRGVWIEARGDVLRQAIKKRVFSRALKKQVNATTELYDRTEQLLREAFAQALSLVNKAGQAIHGREKVMKLLEAQQGSPVELLFHASDGSPDGIRKFRALSEAKKLESIQILTRDELSLALGRMNVIHVAITAGPAIALLRERMNRYRHFVGDTSSTHTDLTMADGIRPEAREECNTV